MTHDISHCEGQKCPRKETCHRYKAHLESIKIGLPVVTYFLPRLQDIENCDMYWGDEK